MISKETENRIIELCNSGMCIRHIAKELNLSDSPVERVLKENGLKDNVRLAHRLCNSIKSDKLIE